MAISSYRTSGRPSPTLPLVSLYDGKKVVAEFSLAQVETGHIKVGGGGLRGEEEATGS